MKYIRKIDYSQRNQNTITCMYYKNSKSLENSIDNSSIQISNFRLGLLFLTNFPQQNFPSLSLGEYPLPLNDIWKTLPVVTYEENFVEHP